MDFPYQTTAQTTAYLQSIVNKAKNLGAKVIVATETDGLGLDAKKNAFNTVIHTQALSVWGVDDVVDIGEIPQLGADGAASNTTYFVAGISPTDAGETLITPLINTAINELLGSTLTSPTITPAASYQELAGDRFLQLSGTTSTITLPSCLGLSLKRQIVNLGTGAATISTLNAEVLAGSATVGAGVTSVFTPVPGAGSSGGCSWSRTL